MNARPRTSIVCVALAVIAAACSPGGDSESTTTVVTPSTIAPTTSPPVVVPPEPPQIVPLLRRSSTDDVEFGQRLSMTSQVLAADPISRLELWVDGSQVDTREFATPQPDPATPWDWPAQSVGLHVAEIRAFDVSGQVAASTPMWFRVEAGWDPSTEELLSDLPPSPLESDSVGVSADVSSCIATVQVPPAFASSGQAVLATTFGYGRWEPIAVLGAAGGEVSVPMTSAPVIVAAHPYDETSASISAPAVVPGDPDCAAGAWSGDVGFVGTVLQGGDGLEAAYLYVTRDDVSWSRIPDSGFVAAGPDGFDFAGLLPPPDEGGHLEVEAWGWEDGQLVELGRGRFESARAPSPLEPGFGSVQPLAPHSDLNIVSVMPVVDSGEVDELLLTQDVLCVEGILRPGCGPRVPTFRWNANLLGAEAGLIQVAGARPPEGPSTDFPGLMWSTMVAMDGATVRDFQLEMVDIFNGAAPSGEGRAAGLQPFDPGWFEYSDLEAMGVELSEVADPAPLGASPRMSQPALGQWWQDVPPSRMWVRVIPFTNGHPIEGTSNAVLFEIDGEEVVIEPPPEQVFDSLFDLEVEFHHPLASNESYAHCVRVIENRHGADNPTDDFFFKAAYDATRDSARSFTANGVERNGLVPGATVCAFKPDPPDKDVFDYVGEAISFVGEAWDTFRDLVDMVKGGIIQGIVDITGCEPEDTCVAALTALADAGLAAVGVPPTLPSFTELAEAAKGDIAAALTKALVGKVCGDVPCAEFAAIFVEDALDDIEEHFSDLATAQAKSGGWVLYLNEEIRVIPEPAGQLFPGSIQVRITRKPDGQLIGSQPPTSCYISLETSGAGPLSWTAKSGESFVDRVVEGPVFAAAATVVDLSKMEPGDSITAGVASLDFDRRFYLTGTSPSLGGYISQEQLQSIELWTDPDTAFTMNASVCGKNLTEVTSQRSALTPGDIPTP